MSCRHYFFLMQCNITASLLNSTITPQVNCLRYKNNHVSPTEIEDILQTHPAVYDCLVFGKQCPQVQELITAVVVKKTNYEVILKTLITIQRNDIGLIFK